MHIKPLAQRLEYSKHISVNCRCDSRGPEFHSIPYPGEQTHRPWGQIPPWPVSTPAVCPHPACWGDLSDADILLPTLLKPQSGLDQNYAHFADEKAEAQRGCIPSWTSVWQLVTEAGLYPRLLTPHLVLFPPHSSGMKSRGCGLVEKGSRPRSPPHPRSCRGPKGL